MLEGFDSKANSREGLDSVNEQPSVQVEDIAINLPQMARNDNSRVMDLFPKREDVIDETQFVNEIRNLHPNGAKSEAQKLVETVDKGDVRGVQLALDKAYSKGRLALNSLISDWREELFREGAVLGPLKEGKDKVETFIYRPGHEHALRITMSDNGVTLKPVRWWSNTEVQGESVSKLLGTLSKRSPITEAQARQATVDLISAGLELGYDAKHSSRRPGSNEGAPSYDLARQRDVAKGVLSAVWHDGIADENGKNTKGVAGLRELERRVRKHLEDAKIKGVNFGFRADNGDIKLDSVIDKTSSSTTFKIRRSAFSIKDISPDVF